MEPLVAPSSQVQRCGGEDEGPAAPPTPRLPDLLTQDLATAEIALTARTGGSRDEIGWERGCELKLAGGRAQLRLTSSEAADETHDVDVPSEMVTYIFHVLDVGPATTYENDISGDGQWGWIELHARVGTEEFRYDVVGMFDARDGAAPLPDGARRVDSACDQLGDLMRRLASDATTDASVDEDGGAIMPP